MNRNSGPGKQYSIGLVLTQAIRKGAIKVTMELLQKGADPNVRDSDGYALTQARGSKELEEGLISYFRY